MKGGQTELLELIVPFLGDEKNGGKVDVNEFLANQKEQREREMNVRRTLEGKVAKLERAIAEERKKEGGGDELNIDRNMYLIEQLNEIRKEGGEVSERAVCMVCEPLLTPSSHLSSLGAAQEENSALGAQEPRLGDEEEGERHEADKERSEGRKAGAHAKRNRGWNGVNISGKRNVSAEQKSFRDP